VRGRRLLQDGARVAVQLLVGPRPRRRIVAGRRQGHLKQAEVQVSCQPFDSAWANGAHESLHFEPSCSRG